MKRWIWVVPLLFLMVSCGPSTNSGVHKTYDVRIDVSGGSYATFTMGVEADTMADTEAGDAPATSEIKVPISAAFKGAQSGATTEGGTKVEGDPVNIEPIDASNRPVTNTTPIPVPTPTPDTGGGTDTDEPGPVVEPDSGTINLDDYDIVAEAPCTNGRCMFPKAGEEYGESFIVQWSSGNMLEVPDSTAAAGSLSTGMRYEPWPTGAVVYADEGDNSTRASILLKKEEEIKYETRFHHTTTASSDGGKSLVLCPGQRIEFDKCTSGGETIPRHNDDKNRETYWTGGSGAEPEGDIVCTKDGKTFVYPANDTIVYGDC